LASSSAATLTRSPIACCFPLRWIADIRLF
jgi:hypothetical protein